MFRCKLCGSMLYAELSSHKILNPWGILDYWGDEGFKITDLQIKFNEFEFSVDEKTQLICTSCSEEFNIFDILVRCRECGRTNSLETSFALADSPSVCFCVNCEGHFEGEERITFADLVKNPPEPRKKRKSKRIPPARMFFGGASFNNSVSTNSASSVYEEHLNRIQRETEDFIQDYLDQFGDEPSDAEIEERANLPT